jgi:hypothetical protein
LKASLALSTLSNSEPASGALLIIGIFGSHGNTVGRIVKS